MVKIFHTIAGQYENIGDAMHRRVLVEWLGKSADMHVYVGAAPDSFLDAVNIDSSHTLYRSVSSWLRACLSASAEDAFVFTSGQMRLRPKRLLGELALFPFVWRMKRQGVAVLRVGVEALPHTALSPSLFNSLIRHTECVWRDEKSREIFSCGTVIPDLAFAEYNDGGEAGDVLAVSMRGDRKYPSRKWFDLVRHIASVHKLRPVTLTQVRRDSRRNAEIASELGCDHIDWSSDMSHVLQERRLNAVYREASVVLSDRLHVLIAGANHHAVPTSPQSEYNEKVNKHFSVIGLKDVAFNLCNLSTAEAKNRVDDLPDTRDKVLACLKEAKLKLTCVQEKGLQFLKGSESRVV
jgi:hypothetical protein